MMKGLGISAAIASASVYYIRKRVSRNWIDCRSSHSNDLTNKVILITGGNTGLGFETAKDLARRNAKVVILCRDMEKGKNAVERIHRDTGKHQNVDCMEVDLASIASVQDFTKRIYSHPNYSTIDVLICNAGVWIPKTKEDHEQEGTLVESKYKTKDGLEIHFGVNHLSHFLLANNLIDALKKSGDGRIVFVSSSLMSSGQVNFDKYDHIYNGRHNFLPTMFKNEDEDDGEATKKKDGSSFAPPPYCDTKLMNALTVKQFSSILPPTVTAYAVCPGWCRSDLGRHVTFPFYKKMLFSPIMLMFQRTSVQGAQNIVFTTIESKDNLKSGAFYRDGEIAVQQTDYVESLDKDLPQKLWKISEKVLNNLESKNKQTNA